MENIIFILKSQMHKHSFFYTNKFDFTITNHFFFILTKLNLFFFCPYMLSFLILLPILAKLSYKLNKISLETDTSMFKYITTKNNYKFYLQKDTELYEQLTLPQQVNKLMNIGIIKIEKNGVLYKIKPFEYLKMEKEGQESLLGTFDKLSLEKNSVVCYYTNGDKCGSTTKCKSKIMFVFSNSDLKIEKYFAGEASSYVFKVSGRFIGEKRECYILHYLPDEYLTDSVIETSEIKEEVDEQDGTPLTFIEQLKLKLQEKYQMMDTDDNREEL